MQSLSWLVAAVFLVDPLQKIIRIEVTIALPCLIKYRVLHLLGLVL